MAVIRVSKTKGFTVMSNYHLRDKNLSLKAKGLLSMMLSLPDGWHYNVRGLAAICKEGVSSISSALKELDQCGYIRRHQPIVDGKFQEIEYIIYETPQPKQEKPESKKAPDSVDKSEKSTETEADVSYSGSTYPENPCSDTAYTDSACTETPCTENLYTGNPDTEAPHTGNSHAYNITNPEKKERLTTGDNNYPSINQRDHVGGMMDRADSTQNELLEKLGATRLTDDFESYREIVKENIDFDILCTRYDREALSGLVELIVEVVCSNAPYTRIGSQDFPTEIVKSRFLHLDSTHIEYVMTSLSMNTTKVRNLKAYLLTTLYNAPNTINQFYENWVLSENPQYAQRR